jgi:hypothetical protein
MATKRVTRDELDDELKRIARSGTDRLVSVSPAGDLFEVTTEKRVEPRMEVR